MDVIRIIMAVLFAYAVSVTTSHASLITLSIQGILDEPFGSVSAGADYSYSFVFDDTRAPLQSGSDNTLYAVESLTLNIGTDVVTASGKTSGDNSGTIRVINDRVSRGDGYFVTSEGLNPGFVGSVGGVTVNQMFLVFRDPVGNMFSSTDLITDTTALQLADLSLSFFHLGCSQGNTPAGTCGGPVDNPSARDFFNVDTPPVSTVPEPTSLSLFAIGLMLLCFSRRRKITQS